LWNGKAGAINKAAPIAIRMPRQHEGVAATLSRVRTRTLDAPSIWNSASTCAAPVIGGDTACVRKPRLLALKRLVAHKSSAAWRSKAGTDHAAPPFVPGARVVHAGAGQLNKYLL